MFSSFRVNTISAAGASLVVASGGTTSDITVGGITYRTHRFTTTGTNTFTVTGGGLVDILLVGGGSRGQRGQNTGGGGGAGGVLRRHYAINATPQSYTIVVGTGGDSTTQTGGNSTGLGYTANGGLTTIPSGYSGNDVQQGRNNSDFSGGLLTNFWAPGAGGAGAGASASNVASNGAGTGGIGAEDSDFTTSPTRYGGGGGGSGGNGSESFGLGGAGGGGRGSNVYGGQAGGTNGLGGGGGGVNTAHDGNDQPGDGGSGIVIIRYAI